MSLPDDFYRQPDVVAALSTHDFGQFFKIVRATFGLTQEELGLLVGQAQSRVCKVENGTARLRDIRHVIRVVRVLKVPADLLGFVGDRAILGGNHDEQEVSWLLDRRDFIATVTAIALGTGVEGPLHGQLAALLPEMTTDPLRRVGLADVERIEATTAAFRDWDHRWGGGGLSRTAIIGQLQWVTDTSRSAVVASEAVRRRLLGAAADLASLGGWVHYDVEQHEQARRLWLVGLDAAREAGNSDLVGDLLWQMAHQALHLQRPDEALRLVRLAYATTADSDYGTPELALSKVAALEAWCHAAAGKLEPCKWALGRAEDHFNSSGDYDVPHWHADFDEVELHGERGHVYHVLADRIPDVAAEAEPLLRQAVADRDPQYARSKTLNLIGLASTYFQRGDGIEEGVRVGYQALDGARTLSSPRSLSRLRGLDQLSARYADEPDVAEFREQLQQLI